MKKANFRFSNAIAGLFACSLFAGVAACDDVSRDDERRLALAGEIAEDNDMDFDEALALVAEADDADPGADSAPTKLGFSAASNPQEAGGCTVISAVIKGKLATAKGTGNANECRLACTLWAQQIKPNVTSKDITFVPGTSVHTCYVTSHLGF